jgi:hypothetical protein
MLRNYLVFDNLNLHELYSYLLIIILLFYWGYIVTFTKVLTIYHS